MKAKTLVSFLCSLLGVAAFGVDLSVANTYTYDSPYKLSANTTCDALKLAEGAVLDLNGYDLTVTAGSDDKAALVTNSVNGTTAHISMSPASNNGWGQQFQGNLKFGGNLELTVCGIVNSGTSWGRRGFQNAHNTHTGGTVLDGYGTNYVNEAEGNLPMWNSADAFGTGPLTLKNGAILKTDANDLNPAFSKLIVDGDGAATNMLYCTNQRFDLRKPVEVTEGNTLHVKYKGRNTWERFMTGDLKDVKGKIIFQAIEDGCQFNIFAGAEYGTFALAGTVANEEDSSKDYNTEIRFNGSDSITLDDPIKIGMIESTADVTATDAKMGFRANFGSNTGFKNLQIGGSGLSGTYYGSIIRHSNGADWNVEKAGAGTWTLGGNTHSEVYRGTTTLSGGTLKLTDAGRLGTGDLIFNGGALGFAADSTNTIANTIVATAAPLKIDADEGACGILSGSTTGATAGLVKTGAGMVKISNLAIKRGSSDQDVVTSDGYSVQFDEGTLGVGTLALDSGETIDLNGRNLAINAHTQTTASNGGSVLKNDAATLSTVTAYGTFPNKTLALQGNIRYVLTGSDGTHHFRTGQEKMNDAVVPNTHTGGTVLSNLVNAVRIYNFTTNIGTGPLVFADGGKVFVASQTDDLFADYTAINNPIEVYGEDNYMNIEGPSWGPGFNFNGAFSGDGELYIYNGWRPYFYFNSNANDGFTGTLYLGYKYPNGDTHNRGFYIGEYGNGFKNATVCLKNVSISGSSTDVPATHLTLQQRGGDVYFGHLVTEGDANEHEDTQIIANHSGATTVHVGAKGLSGTFSGSFAEQDGKTFAIVKEGAGTWTLDGTVESTVSGGITVNAGAIVLNTTLTGTVTVASGASFAGTVPSGGVTFAAGAVFDGDEEATITGDVDLTNTVVEVADVDDVKDGQEFLSVNGTATGKPSLSAVLAAVATRDGQTGRWAVVKATANGETTFTLVWQRPGLIIHVR